MELSLALVTDVHFGPEVRFDGKLRKLSHRAPELLGQVICAVNESVRPDLLVNLGDDIEDESRELDLGRYQDCQRILRGASCPLLNVAGNHDTVSLTHTDLSRIWGREGPLHYSLDAGGFHLVILHTVERQNVDVRIDPGQLAWLREDLRQTALPVVVLMHHSASEQDLRESYWFSRAPHLALVRERAALRQILEESGKVRVVLNGHVHRNYLDVIAGIPYVTLQSLIENLDEDAPGRAAAAFAEVRLDERRVTVRVHGADPARYQFERLCPARLRSVLAQAPGDDRGKRLGEADAASGLPSAAPLHAASGPAPSLLFPKLLVFTNVAENCGRASLDAGGRGLNLRGVETQDTP